jgi:serpin B
MERRLHKRLVPLSLAVAALVSFAAVSCGEPKPSDAPAAASDLAPVVSGNTAFALDLFARIREASVEGNLFFSPYSVSTALAMTYTGARGNTEHEMATVLHIATLAGAAAQGEAPSGPRFWERDRVSATFAALERSLAADPEARGYALHIANSLWGQDGYPFLDGFLKTLERNYGAVMNRVDFVNDAEGARRTINAWAEEKTKERIRDLIPSGALDQATTLVLTNAIYFKGLWTWQFDKNATRNAPFFGESGQTAVPMMFQKHDFRYLEMDGVQVLDMPYRGGNVSMTVILPGKGRPGGLAALERELTPAKLDVWLLGLHEQEVLVYMPKFTMTWGTEELADDLIALGMGDAFRPGVADFSGMDGTRDLFISNVFHKAFVAVDEEGTEAAAATAVAMKRMAASPQTVFRADHPFLFLIRDHESGSILFMGRMADPSA